MHHNSRKNLIQNQQSPKDYQQSTPSGYRQEINENSSIRQQKTKSSTSLKPTQKSQQDKFNSITPNKKQDNDQIKEIEQTIYKQTFNGMQFEDVVYNLQKMQEELTQWKKKCKLIKFIADSDFNPNQTDIDFETYKQLHKSDIDLLNEYISEISKGLKTNINQLQMFTNDKSLQNQFQKKTSIKNNVNLDPNDNNHMQNLVELKNKEIQQLRSQISKQGITSDMIQTLKDHNASLFQDLELQAQKEQNLQIKLSGIEDKLNECQPYLHINQFITEADVLDKMQALIQNVKQNKNYIDELSEQFGSIKQQLDQAEIEKQNLKMKNKELSFLLLESQQELKMNGIILQDELEKQENQINIQYQEYYQQQVQETTIAYINQINDLKNENEHLQQQLTEIQQEFTQKLDIEENLSKENDQLRQQLSPLVEKLKNNEKQLNQYQEQIKQHFQNVNEITEKENINKQTVQEYQKQLQQKQNDYDSMKQKYDKLIFQYNQLIQKIEQNEITYKQFETTQKEVQNERQELLKQINTLKDYQQDSELWKQKYRVLKNEFLELKNKFDDYKNNFLKDVQDKFYYESEAFESNMNMVRERFQSDAEFTLKINQNELVFENQSNSENFYNSQFQSQRVEFNLNNTQFSQNQQNYQQNDGQQSADQRQQYSFQESERNLQRKDKIDKKLNELLTLKSKYESAIENIQNSLTKQENNNL